ncbi:MAG: GIY-YIG nuclease family protein [Candidatus Syntrophoarchaeum sp.]|nr:GIY-YIG nuclease family protein [Candidatus Syntrophoarchaeum sp.]
MIIPAKTIQIFLPDGNPRGLKIAEITSRTVQAILIPRSLLEYAFSRSELNNVGIYLLIGDLAEDGKALVYVGEAEDCLTRLRQQNQAKDFWSVALVIVSKTRYFTKTHVKYLEWYCYTEANNAQRYSLENSSTPTKPFISESMEADLLDNFETIKILVSTLGYPIFDEIKKPQKKNTLVCKGKNAIAEGDYTEDGLIVFAGSEANVEETRSIPLSLKGIRQRLIEAGVLAIDEEGVYKFTSDYIFSSPSAAAGTVLGRSANGWTEWKYKNGKTLAEVHRQAENNAP